MLSLARNIARGEGFDSIWLAVMAENRAARAWYERMGFRIIRRVKYEHFTFEVTLMRRELKAEI